MIERDRRFLSLFLTDPVYVIAEAAPPTHQEEEEEVPVTYMGQNNKQICILVSDAEAEFLSEKDETFLLKILQAVNLSFNDVALINGHNLSETTIADALVQVSYKILICFGDAPEDINLKKYLTKYEYLSDEQDRIYLQADALLDIAADRSRKQQLWKCLQEIFL